MKPITIEDLKSTMLEVLKEQLGYEPESPDSEIVELIKPGVIITKDYNHYFYVIGKWGNYWKTLYVTPFDLLLPKRVPAKIIKTKNLPPIYEQLYITDWYFYLSPEWIKANICDIYEVQIEGDLAAMLKQKASPMDSYQKEFFKLVMDDLKDTFNQLFTSIPD